MVIKTASPGVFVQEVDLTRGVADPVTRNVGVVAGPFKKGPVDQLVYVTEEVEFQRIFGGPTDENYEYWWSVNNFLEYSGNCYVVRCDDLAGDAVDKGAGIFHPQKMRNANDTYYYFEDKLNPEDLSQQGMEIQSDVYMKNADLFRTNFLEEDLILTGNEGSKPTFLARNPGKWSEGLAVAVIDKGADYQLTLREEANTSIQDVNIYYAGNSLAGQNGVPVDVDGGDVTTTNPPNEIDGGTAGVTGIDPVAPATTRRVRKPRFNSNLDRGASVAKYGKIIADIPEYSDLTEENDKEQYLVDVVGKIIRIDTSIGTVVAAEEYIEDNETFVVLTVSFCKNKDGEYGNVFDGTAEGDAIINVTTSLSMGEVYQAYELGDLLYYSKTSDTIINVIFQPKYYDRDQGIEWLWPNRPFDGEKVYNGKVAVDLQGATVTDLNGDEVTVGGPAVVASAIDDTISWNARREVWEVNYIPRVDDIIYDDKVDDLGQVPVIYQIGRVSDWYSQQIAFEGIPWRSFGPRPGTSANAQDFNCFDDEMHLIVYDAYGEVTGQKGSTIEQYTLVSKLKGAKTVEGSNNYYKDLINRESEVLFQNYMVETITGSLNFEKSDPGTAISTGVVCKLLAPRFGTVTRNKILKAAVNTPAAERTTENFPYLMIGSNDQLTASLGEVQAGYEKVVEENIDDLDYIIQGPAYDTTLASGNTLGQRVAESVGKANYLISLGERLKSSMVLISPPRCSSLEPINAGEITKRILEWAGQISSSSYAVMDSGYKYMYDRFSDKYRYVPLNADIAGTMAQATQFSEPFFSPAGMVRGQIRSVIKLGYDPSKDQRDQLYAARVNPVVTFPGEGTVLYGDKTCLGYASAFTRINVRRLFIYAEREIAKLAKSVLFEFNDVPTRVNFKNTVDPFLRDIVSKRGAIDFLVVCDTSNNTPEVIDRNEFVADIYIKPNRSINFVMLTFVATKTGVSFSEAVGANRRANIVQ